MVWLAVGGTDGVVTADVFGLENWRKKSFSSCLKAESGLGKNSLLLGCY